MTNNSPLRVRSRIRFLAVLIAAAICCGSLALIERSSRAQRRAAVRVAKSAKNSGARAGEKGQEQQQIDKIPKKRKPRKPLTYSPVSATTETTLPAQLGSMGIERTVFEIINQQTNAPVIEREPRLMLEREYPDRKKLSRPKAKQLASWPSPTAASGAKILTADTPAPNAPQTVSTPNFTAATLADTGAFPPDTMGAVGPTQFIAFLNGRVRSFTKSTGAADGVINADADLFFSSVMTPLTGGVTLNFTSDPQIRYDRLSRRWILTIIDVPSTSPASIGDRPNRLLIAVSDAASNGVISPSTVFTFFFVQQDTVGPVASTNEFLDYPSLGVDKNALYVGGDMFDATTSFFITTTAFVIQKTSVLGAGPVVVTAFRGLIPDPDNDDGPLSPRGVDNFDPASNEGYFIGSSNQFFSQMNMRRIANPGTASPTISADILVGVPLATLYPEIVPHLGNTGGTNGRLDALGDRLFAAHIRNGRLWTAHNIEVNTTGAASASGSRNGVRWYEFIVPPGAGMPSVNQSGTVFDSASSNPQYFFVPTVMVSGQGHAAFGFSAAGNNNRVNAATNGRLRTNTLGTTGSVALYTASSSAYNPPSDPGGPPDTGGGGGRRWGDYSFVSLDPKDDMTMWSIQEFCNATNSYGVQVVRLLGPAPATPATASPAVVPTGIASQNVTITGTSISGSEFFDPGSDIAGAEPFTHIGASVSGGVTVNSVIFTDATHVTLNISTVGASSGAQTVTVTNPDGQTAQGFGIITIGAAPSAAQMLISEFRFRGTASGSDEFIEVYNNSDSPLTVADTAGGAGYAVAGTNTTGTSSLRCTVPNGTVIPARGHYLCVNSSASGYSLGTYAVGDTTYTTGIVDGGGVALFSTTTSASWSTSNRFDSVGFQGITGTTLFTEGTALSPSGGITTNGEYSFVRKLSRASNGIPQDTNDNQADFAFVSATGGLFSARQSTLGAPGPENLVSPIQRNSQFVLSLLDPAVSKDTNPNRVRVLTSDPVNNSTFGTMTIRRTITNNTGTPITRLRFRIVEITTFTGPAIAGVADLRARTSSGPQNVTITGANAACPANTCVVQALTLESPSAVNNGGLNSSLADGTVTVTPIPPGGQINIQFLLGVQQPGTYSFFLNVEALP